jgi:hypothetical protein
MAINYYTLSVTNKVSKWGEGEAFIGPLQKNYLTHYGSEKEI